MKQKSGPVKQPAEGVVRDLRRATRRQFSAEEKIRIVLEGLRGEESMAELCRREGIASSMYYGWSKDFLEAGKKRLAGDTARAATPDEVKELRREEGERRHVLCAGPVDHHARTNLSSNMMANWVFASPHSRGDIFHSAAVWRKTR